MSNPFNLTDEQIDELASAPYGKIDWRTTLRQRPPTHA